MTQRANHNNNYVKGSEVFVGGLPTTVTENKIHEVFSECGNIAEVRLMKDQKGNVKGFCFVKFGTKEAAEKAVKEKNGITLDGKKIGVLPSNEQNTLYFGNLNKGWSASEFEGIVRQVFPDVVSVDLAMQQKVGETQTGRKQLNRGFGFVTFSSHAAASRAHRLGSKGDFTLGGKSHPAVEWAEDGSEVDPNVLAKIKIAFIRNLPADADESYLKKLFEPWGEIEKVVLLKKGKSPVGFVHFAKRTDLDIAIKEMNMKAVQGPNGGPTCNLSVEVARPMEKNKKRAREDSESLPPNINMTDVSEDASNAYSIDHVSVIPASAAQQELNYVDPYEAAVVALPGIVKERVLRILRLGIATRADIDIQTLTSLRELPESTAISVLDQLMLYGADTKDKGIYLAGLIFKHQNGKHSRNELPRNLPRLAEVTQRDISLSSFCGRLVPEVSVPNHVGRTLTSYSDRVHLPAVRSNSPPAGFAIPRHDDYVVRSAAAAVSEYPVLTRSSLGMPTELNSSALIAPSPSSVYGRKWSPSRPSAVEYQDRIYLNPHIEHLSALEGLRSNPRVELMPAVQERLKTTLDRASVDEYHPTPQPQVRFDPYTGEPYKFDPFTGEPIVPGKLPRRS